MPTASAVETSACTYPLGKHVAGGSHQSAGLRRRRVDSSPIDADRGVVDVADERPRERTVRAVVRDASALDDLHLAPGGERAPASDSPRTTVGNEPGVTSTVTRSPSILTQRRCSTARRRGRRETPTSGPRARRGRARRSFLACVAGRGGRCGRSALRGLAARAASSPAGRAIAESGRRVHSRHHLRSSARARWISDPTVPGRQPSAAAISASLASCQKRRTTAARWR